MYSSIYAMRQDLERIRKPVGTRDNPVRTCKDLFYGHPQFKDGECNRIRSNLKEREREREQSCTASFSGWYWIDPNLGMSDDAVYVFCNITAQGETCVFPDIHSSQMPNIPWRKEGDKTDWYSNLRGGFRVSVPRGFHPAVPATSLTGSIFSDNLRDHRRRPDDVPATAEPGGVPELHVHVHKRGRVAQPKGRRL